jgi:hypothetical protein
MDRNKKATCLVANSFDILIALIGANRVKIKRVSYFYRAATTLYPCCVPTLGEFKRSWP